VKEIHKIICDMNGPNFPELKNSTKLNGILSLHVFPPSTTNAGIRTSNNVTDNSINGCDIIIRLLNMIPNVREIDFSNNNLSGIGSAFDLGYAKCLNNNLETIRYNNAMMNSDFGLDGECMKGWNNVRQIIMDHSIFQCSPWDGQEFKHFERNNNNKPFLFHLCCKNLERVSIRNAKYAVPQDEEGEEGCYDNNATIKRVTQKALIKFVRNAPPSLLWFRSDLSPNNIQMLQTERPTIEFLN